MRTEGEKKLDELFRTGLENPNRDINFREDDWDAMEALLDKNKKRRGLIFWLPVLGSIAAMLILTLGWFLIANKPHNITSTTQVRKPIYGDLKKSNNSTTIANGQVVIADTTAKRSNNITRGSNATQSNNIGYIINKTLLSKHLAHKTDADNNNILNGNDEAKTHLKRSTYNTKKPIFLQEDNNSLLIAALPDISFPNMHTELINRKIPLIEPEVKIQAKENKISIKPAISFRPSLAITVLASPDINGVNSFQNSKVGSNAGLIFSVGISKKFTISTGAIFSNKPYMTDFSNYHTNYKFSTNPENVSANCKVLDIPINIDYQFYNKYKNKLSIGSGLSSYFMLRENYHYNYEYANTPGPTDYNIANRNKYLLGVLNIDATYQRQINSKFSISVQPYLKLPLTNIGYSQVKLQSTGVAIGVSWNVGSYLKH